ncbi:hypothetical protein ACIBHX_46705 [Nonomuraea sp. NPDC050536]|uniref:hypothetical protein n=1 Tax=Nonomuraea sp. NPDC050536 TaxID=3364366 RepID=UPI0037CB2157
MTSHQALRAEHADILRLARSPFDIDDFCARLSEFRGQRVIAVPFQPSGSRRSGPSGSVRGGAVTAAGCKSGSGFWFQGPDPLDPDKICDMLLYAKAPSIPPDLQVTYFAHELGHMLDQPVGGEALDREQREALAEMIADVGPLLEFGGMESVHTIMGGRTYFRGPREERAEIFAYIFREQLRQGLADEDGSMAARMAIGLRNPFGRKD